MNAYSMNALCPLVLACMVAVAGAGCATNAENKLPDSRRAALNDDSTFAAGAGRAPSAATSYAFAKILVTQGRDRDAMYVLARVIREHPTYLPAYNELAGVYVRADRLEDAAEVLNAALKHAPNDGVIHNNLGMCYMLAGQNEKALEAFSQAARAMPSNPTFRANRAAALGLVGREAEAQDEYRTVIGELATLKNLTILARARGDEPESADPKPPQGDAAPQTDHKTDATAPAEERIEGHTRLP